MKSDKRLVISSISLNVGSNYYINFLTNGAIGHRGIGMGLYFVAIIGSPQMNDPKYGLSFESSQNNK